MGNCVLIVPSSAIGGGGDDYNEWYDSTHLAEFLAIPGVVSLRRLQALPNSPSPTPGEYLAIVEIEADDPMSVFAAIAERGQRGLMSPPPPALDMSSVAFWLYSPR